jgi:K+-transporting ATPase ATPase C chain
MRTVATYVRTASTSLRMLLVLTVILGIGYPLAITALAQIPGLKHRADGSLVTLGGRAIGSGEIGQTFTDAHGRPLPQYFQSRPSAAGYDPTASSASNLGPESIVDTLPNPATKGDTGTPSLLTQVCHRSLEVGRLDGVDGSRPYCSPDGTGSVLAVFWSGPGYHGHVVRVVSINQGPNATPFVSVYKGIEVQTARYGEDYRKGQLVPVRGNAPADPAVPADAVTASGSGLDPDISPEYAKIQEALVARTRRTSVGRIAALVAAHTDGRALGFMGEPTVNVLELNLALDRTYPMHSR